MSRSNAQWTIDKNDRKKAEEWAAFVVDYGRRNAGVVDEVALGAVRAIAREVIEGAIKYGRRLERDRIARSRR